MTIQMGQMVRDVVTGVQGHVIGFVTYITGCD